MKRILSIALTLCMALSLFVFPANAASDKAKAAADELHELGLFGGVGTNADGSINYDLDRAPSRAEGVTMLVRMLGKEDEAKAGTWTTPFSDVADWAKPYVGYAYTNGLTNGVGDDGKGGQLFGSNATINATQYLTFVLRSLGYESGKDFQWDKAWELTDELGITNGEYNASTNSSFLRSDIALVSLAAHEKSAELIGENNVARVGRTGYETLAAAVVAATADQTVTLLKDVTEAVTIPSGKTVTLDLNGHKLSNAAGQHTIVNNGTLTITGNGTVDNNSNGKGALYNDGTATVNGGTFTHSNRGTVLYNLGTMTINDGVFTGAISKTGGEISVTVGTFSDPSVLNYVTDYQLIRLASEDVMTLKTDERLEITGELQVCGSLKISGRGTLAVIGLVFVFNSSKDIDLDISELNGLSIGGEGRGPIILENGAKLKVNPNWKGHPFPAIWGVDDHNDSEPERASYDASNSVYSYTAK